MNQSNLSSLDHFTIYTRKMEHDLHSQGGVSYRHIPFHDATLAAHRAIPKAAAQRAITRTAGGLIKCSSRGLARCARVWGCLHIVLVEAGGGGGGLDLGKSPGCHGKSSAATTKERGEGEGEGGATTDDDQTGRTINRQRRRRRRRRTSSPDHSPAAASTVDRVVNSGDALIILVSIIGLSCRL